MMWLKSLVASLLFFQLIKTIHGEELKSGDAEKYYKSLLIFSDRPAYSAVPNLDFSQTDATISKVSNFARTQADEPSFTSTQSFDVLVEGGSSTGANYFISCWLYLVELHDGAFLSEDSNTLLEIQNGYFKYESTVTTVLVPLKRWFHFGFTSKTNSGDALVTVYVDGQSLVDDLTITSVTGYTKFTFLTSTFTKEWFLDDLSHEEIELTADSMAAIYADVNECSLDENACPNGPTDCVNLVGTYSCNTCQNIITDLIVDYTFDKHVSDDANPHYTNNHAVPKDTIKDATLSGSKLDPVSNTAAIIKFEASTVSVFSVTFEVDQEAVEKLEFELQTSATSTTVLKWILSSSFTTTVAVHENIEINAQTTGISTKLNGKYGLSVSVDRISVFADGVIVTSAARPSYLKPFSLDQIKITAGNDNTKVDNLQIRDCALTDAQQLVVKDTDVPATDTSSTAFDFTGTDDNAEIKQTFIKVSDSNDFKTVITLDSPIVPADCSKAYYQVFTSEVNPDDPTPNDYIHETFCGTKNLERIVTSKNIYIRVVSDDSLTSGEDKLKLNIYQGPVVEGEECASTQCTGSGSTNDDKCMELYPGTKCRECAAETKPWANFDFQLGEGEVFQGTVEDKSGNENHATYGSVVDAAILDIEDEGSDGQKVLKASGERGLKLDLSTMSVDARRQFSVHFFVKVPACPTCGSGTGVEGGDLVTFYGQGQNRLMALVLYIDKSVVFQTHDTSTTYTSLPITTDAWISVMFGARRNFADTEWEMLLEVAGTPSADTTIAADLVEDWQYLVIGQHGLSSDTYTDLKFDDFKYYDCFYAAANTRVLIDNVNECTDEFENRVDAWYDFSSLVSTTENMAGVLHPGAGKSIDTFNEAPKEVDSGKPHAIDVATTELSFTVSSDKYRDAVTIMFWFEATSSFAATGSKVVTLTSTDSESIFVEFQKSPTKMLLKYNDGSADRTLLELEDSSGDFTDATYSAFAFTIERNGYARAFVDGVEKKSVFVNLPPLTTSGSFDTASLGEDTANNEMSIGGLRVYACALSAEIIGRVHNTNTFSSTEEDVDSDDLSEVYTGGTTNKRIVIKVSGTGSFITAEWLEKVIADCNTKAIFYFKVAKGDWFNLCETELPLMYNTEGATTHDVQLWFISNNNQDKISFKANKEETPSCTDCEQCASVGAASVCLDCSFEDLYKKTFIKIHPFSESQGLAAHDTPFGNIGHKVGTVPDYTEGGTSIDFTTTDSYIYFENVQGVPKYGLQINIVLEVTAIADMAILTVFDKNGDAHLTLKIVAGHISVVMVSQAGETYTFTSAETAFTANTKGNIGLSIGLDKIEIIDAFTDLHETPTQPSNMPEFFLINTDWSRLEFGRVTGAATSFTGKLYALYISSCLTKEAQKPSLINGLYTLDDVTPVLDVHKTFTYAPVDAIVQQLDVAVGECEVVDVDASALTGQSTTDSQEMYVVNGKGNLSYVDCKPKCTLDTSSTLLYYSSMGSDTPSINIQYTKNLCCSGEHKCVSDVECYKTEAHNHYCETCHGEGREGLYASIDFQRSTDLVDYRPSRHDEDNYVYVAGRTQENGVKYNTASANIINLPTDLKFLTIHFWFEMSTAGAYTLLTTTEGTTTLTIKTVDTSDSFYIFYSLGGTTYEHSDATADNIVYEVALLIKPTELLLYIDGVEVNQVTLSEPLDLDLSKITFTDVGLGANGYIQDLEVWTCIKPEYTSKIEMQHADKLETAQGVIEASTITATSSVEVIYFIEPKHNGDSNDASDVISYEFIKNSLDCSYADFFVLEKESLETDKKIWKSYCHSADTIFGFTTGESVYAKYVNYDHTKPVPDFYFSYAGDENECSGGTPPCATPNTCTNKIPGHNCIDCDTIKDDGFGFDDEHVLFFDFETVNGDQVTDKGSQGLTGTLTDASAVKGNFKNHQIDTSSNGNAMLTVNDIPTSILPTTKFTLGMMVEVADITGVIPLFYSYNSKNVANILFELHDGYPYIEIRDTNGQIMKIFSEQTDISFKLVADTPTFVGAIYNEGAVTLYLGEVPKNSASGNIYQRPISQDWSGGVKIGYRDPQLAPFHGKLDDVRLIACALSVADIQFFIESFDDQLACTITQATSGEVTTFTSGVDVYRCSATFSGVDAPSAFQYARQSGYTCGFENGVRLVTADDTVIDMCKLENQGFTYAQDVFIYYAGKTKTAALTPILTATLVTDECSPMADPPHTCGEDSNCFDADKGTANTFICIQCQKEFSSQLLLYYDFEDTDQVLNKADDTKSIADFDKTTGVTIENDAGIFNKGLKSVVSTSWTFANLNAPFMLISLWVVPDDSASSSDMLFKITSEIEISINALTLDAVVTFGGNSYTLQVTGLVANTPTHVQLSFNDDKLELKAGDNLGTTIAPHTLPITTPDRFDWTTSKDVELGNTNVPIDELRIYSCASLKDSISTRHYVADHSIGGTSVKRDVVKAPSASLPATTESYEGRWYILQDTDKIVYVDFLQLPPGGVVKYRDEISATQTDGRDDWVTVTEPGMVQFTNDAVIWYYTTSPEIEDFKFEFYKDSDYCALEGTCCGGASCDSSNCANTLGGYYCLTCDLPTSLILHYDFEDKNIDANTNKILDVTNNDNDGTNVNKITTTQTMSPIGAYATLKLGEGIVLHDIRPVPQNTITVATFVRLTNDILGVRPLFNVYDAERNLVLSIDLVDGILTLNVPGSSKLVANTVLTVDTMHHIAVAIKRTEVTFYLDGSANGAHNTNLNIEWSIDWEVVEVGRKESHHLEYLEGDLDQFKVFNCYLAADVLTGVLVPSQEFDRTTYYCKHDVVNPDPAGSFLSPVDADITNGETKIDCSYSVTADEKYKVYFKETDADNVLEVTTTSGQDNTFSATFVQGPIPSTKKIFSVDWKKDLNECHSSFPHDCADFGGCVDRIGDAYTEDNQMCRNCKKYNEENLKLYYKFNHLSESGAKVKDRANEGLITAKAVTTSNVQIGGTDVFNGNYLDAPLSMTLTEPSTFPTDAFTIFARVLTSTITGNEENIFEAKNDASDKYVKLYITDGDIILEVQGRDSPQLTTVSNAFDAINEEVAILAIFEPDGSFMLKVKPKGSTTKKSTLNEALTNEDFPTGAWKNLEFISTNVKIDEFMLFDCALEPQFQNQLLIRDHVYEEITNKESGKIYIPTYVTDKTAIDHEWKIVRPQPTYQTVSLQFENFNVDCNNGYLQILDDPDGEFKKYCGTKVTDAFEIIDNDVVIRYVRYNMDNTEDTFNIYYKLEVNECKDGSNPCTGATCINTFGSYQCSECTDDAASLILHYDFEDGNIDDNKNKILDVTDNDNDGTNVNKITTTQTDSPIGAYATFAINDGIVVNDMRPVPKNMITLASWIRIDDNVSGRRPLFHAFDIDRNLVFSIDICDGLLTLTTSGSTPLVADTAIVTGIFTHVAVAVSRTDVNFYINGDAAGDGTNQNLVWSSDWEVVEIGRNENRDLEYLEGHLDDFRIYNCYLNNDQVKMLYNMFDPLTYYCKHVGDTSQRTGTFLSPVGGDIANSETKIDCSYSVTADEKYKVYFEKTDDDNVLDVTTTSRQDNTFLATFVEDTISSPKKFFSVEWEKDLNECHSSFPHDCADFGGCVDRIGVAYTKDNQMCRHCRKYNDDNLRLYYKFNHLTDSGTKVKDRGMYSLGATQAVTTSNSPISGTDAFDGNYLNAPVSITLTETSIYPTDAFTIFARVLTGSLTGTEDNIFKATGSGQVVKLYIDNTNIVFDVNGETTTYSSAVGAINEWMSVLATFEPDGEITLKVKSSQPSILTSTPNEVLTNEDFPKDAWSTSHLASVNVKMDEFMLFGCALNADHQDELLNRYHERDEITDSISGKISIPQYNTHKAVDYEWKIVRPEPAFQTVSLEFVDFNVDCDYGYIQILDDPEGQFQKICGPDVSDILAQAFRIIDNDVVVRYVRYNMDSSFDDSFKIFYNIETNECQQNTHDCDDLADCVNTYGSYHCSNCRNGEEDAILHLNFDTVSGIEIRDANDKSMTALSSADDVSIGKSHSSCQSYLKLSTGRHIRVMPDKLRYIPSKAFTLELLVYLEDITGCRPVFQVNHKDGGHIMQLDIEEGKVAFKLLDSEDNEISLISTTTPITKEKWYRVSVTYNKLDIKVYVDGAEVATKAFTGKINQHWSSMDVGTKEGSPTLSMNGNVDEIKLYGCAITGTTHDTCSLTTYYCDDKLVDIKREVEWQLPSAESLAGFTHIDCSLAIPAGKNLYRIFVQTDEVTCPVEKLEYRIDDEEDFNYCAEDHASLTSRLVSRKILYRHAGPENIVFQQFALHYKSDDISHINSLNLLIHKDCGDNAHYYSDEDLCQCENGYVLVEGNCTDLNECLCDQSNGCHANAECTNLEGSYKCKCLHGYAGDGFQCKANDPCLKNVCGNNEVCVWPNMYTIDYECICPAENSNMVEGQCIKNECKANDLTCDENAHCANGACVCNTGYEGDGIVCKDENECDSVGNCAANEDCHNTPGSFFCTCKKGYARNDATDECEDVNECVLGWKCPVNSVCNNNDGGYECQCKPGYVKKDELCVDKNECVEATDNTCSEHAQCVNSAGSYSCHCNPGYSGDGRTCNDINECDDTSVCNQDNEKCENQDGYFRCVCDVGFYRYGKLCVDREEADNGGDGGNGGINDDDNGYCLYPNGHRYKSYPPMSWSAATAQCASDEAQLAIVEGVKVVGEKTTWLGGRRLAGESVWKWSNGDTIVKTRWADGYPKIASTSDACIYSAASVWRDALCDGFIPVLCEREQVVLYTDVCSAPCGTLGLIPRTTDSQLAQEPCNRFDCYATANVEKPAVCMQLPSPLDTSTILPVTLGWNEDKMMNALGFVRRWRTQVDFDASWRDESCCEFTGIEEKYKEELVKVHETVEKLASYLNYMRALYNCNSNTHVRGELIDIYKQVVLMKWRIEAHLQHAADLSYRVEAMAQICAGRDWMSLSEKLTMLM